MRDSVDRAITVCAAGAAVLLVVAAASASGIAPLRAASTAPDSPETPRVAANVTVAGANDSAVLRHRRPADVRESPRLDSASLRLARSLGVRLNVSAQALLEENFSAARARLGPAYRRDVVRLTDVAEATENVSDDRLAEAFREAGTTQREAAREAARFRDLYREYQEARASGNETAAREAARELGAQVDDLERTGDRLGATYRTLEGVNETRAERAQRTIDRSVRRAERLARNAREATFAGTELRATAVRGTGSPSRPFVVRGTLRTTNGTPLAGRTVAVGPPAHVSTARTNATGEFRLAHRPTVLERGDRSVEVRYEPGSEAGYLGSNATANVSVRSGAPTLELQAVPGPIASGSPGEVSGRLLANGTAVPGVPVTVSLSGRHVSTVRTNGTGHFAVPVRPFRDTPAGEASLEVGLPLEDRAVAPVDRERAVTVAPTATELSLTVERVGEGEVRVDGRLRTAAGRPVRDRSVTVTVEGRPVGWFATDDGGRFGGTLLLTPDHPAVAGHGPELAVEARFANESTHLDAARARRTVTLPSLAPPGAFGFGVSSSEWLLVGGAVALLGVAGLLTARRRGGSDAPESVEEPAPAPTVDPEPDPGPDLAAAFEAAADAVPDDPRRAIRLGYGAVRADLAGELALDPDHRTMTHWEFYRACDDRDAGPGTLDPLRRLTGLYERAAYTDRPVRSAAARAALSAFDERFEAE